MSAGFKGWPAVAVALRQMADQDISAERNWSLNEGQRRSLRAIASRIHKNGVVLADEVGMGKTRIAVALAHAVTSCGGRVAVLMPPGLGFQWADELCDGQVPSPPLLHSLWQFYSVWSARAPHVPWAQHQVVLVSHLFANWRKREASDWWRWGLLSEVVAHLKKAQTRFPNGYEVASSEKSGHFAAAVTAAAREIAARAASDARFQLAINGASWQETLDTHQYGSKDGLRPALERAVGLGLGTFDLVILDEAHKSRGVKSGVERLLDLVVESKDCRRVSMTATPVELSATQWIQALKRINVDPVALKDCIERYAFAAKDVRASPTIEPVRERFEAASSAFHAALTPFLLRRDKRENPRVKQFAKRSELPINEYRREAEISVDPNSMTLGWRRAVCAAEALSLAASGGGDPAAQRLRLTIGNGHGINELLDRATCDDDLDKAQKDQDAKADEESGTAASSLSSQSTTGKQAKRIEWWKRVVRSAFQQGEDDALFDHPGIAAAVQAVEAAYRRQEKVLVFGRFTRPMRALVELLNARMMLLCLRDGISWPQASVHEQEWAAVQVAQRQLKLFQGEGRSAIDEKLDKQYEALHAVRHGLRSQLLSRLEEGLVSQPADGLARHMFKAMKESEEGIASVTRAIAEMLGDKAGDAPSSAWADEFNNLVLASAERDESEDLDDLDAMALWKKLADRLDKEYKRPEGGFARLMYGKTEHTTRRLLQLAFNRTHSYPRVLVAQSVVGREGLNLHRACRTVLLLHPEWNPAVVEQQIGRVDRLGSRWEQLVEITDECSWRDDPPRIEILPIVFKGTYDEHQWQVLRDRWNDLRAQLHGVVIPPSASDGDVLLSHLAREINGKAPNFSPQE
jgi:superfamily II DNA or RNA helicase